MATSRAKPRKGRSEELDPYYKARLIRRFESRMKSRVIGQDHALDEITNSMSRMVSGIRDPERPVMTLLLMGPSGVGKTETVKALAEVIFGSHKAFTRVNCQEFSQEFTISKLLGSPPGYVGGDIPPMMSQENVDKHHKQSLEEGRGIFAEDAGGPLRKLFSETEGRYLGIVLFDEIEKAHPKVWSSLLGILEDGHLTLGNNEEVDFTRSIVILTSNVGSEEMGRTISDGVLGFQARKDLNVDLRTEALDAAKRIFPFEFLNRFDELVFYHMLDRTALQRILDLLLQDVHNRLLRAGVPMILSFTQPVKNYLLDKGTDEQFGARPLKRLLEKELVTPLSNLIASKQIGECDLVTISREKGQVRFTKDVAPGAEVIAPRGEPEEEEKP